MSAEATKRKWKPASRNRYQAAISLVFRVAVDNQKLTLNPAAGIQRLREDNECVRFLSPEEEAKLTAVVEERFPEYVPVMQLGIHTGTRTSELLRARVGDFNPDTGKFTVRQKKVRNSSPFRYVPLSPIAIAAYKKLGRRQAAGRSPLLTAEWRRPSGDTLLVRHLCRSCRSGRLNLEISDSAHGGKSLGDGWYANCSGFQVLRPRINTDDDALRAPSAG